MASQCQVNSDLADALDAAGLEGSYWSDVFQKEFGITKQLQIKYLDASDLEILLPVTRWSWEKKALRTFLGIVEGSAGDAQVVALGSGFTAKAENAEKTQLDADEIGGGTVPCLPTSSQLCPSNLSNDWTFVDTKHVPLSQDVAKEDQAVRGSLAASDKGGGVGTSHSRISTLDLSVGMAASQIDKPEKPLDESKDFQTESTVGANRKTTAPQNELGHVINTEYCTLVEQQDAAARQSKFQSSEKQNSSCDTTAEQCKNNTEPTIKIDEDSAKIFGKQNKTEAMVHEEDTGHSAVSVEQDQSEAPSDEVSGVQRDHSKRKVRSKQGMGKNHSAGSAGQGKDQPVGPCKQNTDQRVADPSEEYEDHQQSKKQETPASKQYMNIPAIPSGGNNEQSDYLAEPVTGRQNKDELMASRKRDKKQSAGSCERNKNKSEVDSGQFKGSDMSKKNTQQGKMAYQTILLKLGLDSTAKLKQAGLEITYWTSVLKKELGSEIFDIHEG